MGERQELLAAMMERKNILQREAPEKIKSIFFRKSRSSEEQRFKEELDLLGKKHWLERMKKERERAKVEGEREKNLLLKVDSPVRQVNPMIQI